MSADRPSGTKEHDAAACCEGQPLARIIPGQYWRLYVIPPLVLGIILVLLIGSIWVALGILWVTGAVLLLIPLAVALLLSSIYWLPGVTFWGYYGERLNYQALGQESDSFRLLQISPGHPGAKGENIQCQLVHGRFRTAEYIALSYSWDTSQWIGQAFSRRILIDNKARRLSQPVHDALCSLVDPQTIRHVWIDSICIAQVDAVEKAAQVGVMLEIYEYAREVTVWLDTHVGLSPTWQVLYTITQSIDTADDVSATLFEKLNLLVDDDLATVLGVVRSMSEKESNLLKDILNARWWERVWIVQEVAVNAKVMFRYREWSVPWVCLSRFVQAASDLDPRLVMPPKAMRLIKSVEMIRSSSEESRRDLLALVHRFEDSEATLTQDKIFALMGLVPPAENTLNFCIDYKSHDYQVFARFTKSHLAKHQSLAALIALESDCIWDPSTVLDVIMRTGEGLDSMIGSLSVLMEHVSEHLCDLDTWRPSYAIDWSLGYRTWSIKRQDRLSWVPLRNVKTKLRKAALWDADLGGASDSLRINDAHFQASGNCPARIDTSLPDPEVISVQGWELDTVQTVSDIFSTRQSMRAQARQISKWERLAGGPWSVEDHDLQIAFLSTITAGHNITALSSMWQLWFTNHADNKDGLTRLRAVCTGRRLFLTSTGMMGLGHTGMRKGDRVCVLPGADVPYILRRSTHESSWTGFHSGSCRFAPVCKRNRHLRCCLPPLHRLIGQAYVHGKMQYQGDVAKDAQEGRVKVETFGIE